MLCELNAIRHLIMPIAKGIPFMLEALKIGALVSFSVKVQQLKGQNILASALPLLI